MAQLGNDPPAHKTEQRKALYLYFSLPILSWALYDFANTIFSSNIITIFFPFYLQEVIGGSERLNQIASTFISYANALSSLFLVIFTPLFGVLIDRTGKKKKYIIPLTLIAVLCTVLMGVFSVAGLEQTVNGLPITLFLVVLFYVIAKFFYNSSLVFYDAMISDLGTKKEIPLISGFGVAVGYVGTVVGLTVYLYVGNDGFHEAFIPTAILYLLFSLPLFFLIKEKPTGQEEKKSFFSGYKEIIATFKEMKAYRSTFLFLIVYFFINDALATTIAMMAIYAKAIVGFTSGQFIILYLVSTVTAIIGSFIFGYVTKALGAKKAVEVVGFLLLFALAIATFAINEAMFWFAGSLFGVALGAVWVTSRTLIVELTPEHKRGQFFGLFAFSGKISSIIGPFIYGTITLVLAEYGNLASRFALGSLMILVLIGLIVHQKVKTSEV
ncbi:MFS transporter [Metabacillus fastidiosus]|uniref:MFS transporter n=1 Tax=Metabacillus fastidiosus TaxID=1458 RepID=A0ABU6P332_9BACI|nr:MFS transporter [Metabacillus fastidiosus]MED4403760.1 MFS transporter [Metabacillus fastidiosus]MED4463530.1 MFS transporter [Metabacillus fastidiosus]